MEIALVVAGLLFAYVGFREVRFSRIKLGGRYDKQVEMMSTPRFVLVSIQILAGAVMAIVGALQYFEMATLTEDDLRLVLIVGGVIALACFLLGIVVTSGGKKR